jgi:hypothetical protein
MVMSVKMELKKKLAVILMLTLGAAYVYNQQREARRARDLTD